MKKGSFFFSAGRRTDDDLMNWRERILAGLLAAATLFGMLAYGFYLPMALRAEQYIAVGIYTTACVGLIFLTIFRRLPYNLRTHSLLGILYVVGVLALINDGLYGSGRIFLLVVPLVGSILLGSTGGTNALILSMGAFGAVGLLMTGGYLPIPDISESTSSANPQSWISAGMNFGLLSITVTMALVVLVKGLEHSLQVQKNMADQMEEERLLLEERVSERTQALERRLGQIYTAADISRAISAVLDRQALLQQVVDLVKQRFDLYYVGVFLVDSPGEYAVLKAGTGEAGRRMIAEGHRLKIGGTSMVGWACEHKEPRITMDVGSETVHFRNPHLPMTLSEMALPLLSGQKLLGALTIQSAQPNAFDRDDITVLKAIADTLATALENADLFQELETRLDEIRTLHAQYLIQAWAEAPRMHEDLSFTYEASPGQSRSDNRSFLEMPVSLRGQNIGRIILETDQEYWSEEDLVFIDSVATEAAIALENARLLEENQRRAQREFHLSQISAKTQQYMDIDMVIKTAVQEISRAIKAPKVRILLTNDGRPGEQKQEDHKRSNGNDGEESC
jgi:GAF domain-containing protein